MKIKSILASYDSLPSFTVLKLKLPVLNRKERNKVKIQYFISTEPSHLFGYYHLDISINNYKVN